MSSIAKRITKLSTEKRRLLAQQLKREKGPKLRDRIPPQPRDRGPLPLSFSQERLWFLNQLEPASCVYNLCYALRLRGRLAVPALARSLRELVRRHESLRTTFDAIDGKPIQVIHEPPEFPLPVVTLEALPAAAARRAGVSSFGIGGTNVHAILEEAPPRPASGPSRPHQLLALSARSDDALEAITDNLARHLHEHETHLADVAFTLHLGRGAFEHRRILVGTGAEDAAEALGDRKRLLSATVDRDVGVPPVVFLFPGQGAQYAGMGQELYAGEEVFRTEMDSGLTLA